MTPFDLPTFLFGVQLGIGICFVAVAAVRIWRGGANDYIARRPV